VAVAAVGEGDGGRPVEKGAARAVHRPRTTGRSQTTRTTRP
jgi:hypothetical protein